MALRLARRRSATQTAKAISAPAPGPHRNHMKRNELKAIGPDPLRPEARLRWRDHFTLSENVLHVPGMHREHDGLRIAHLSDIHVGQATSAVRVRRAVAEVNARNPDLVFLTGDYVTHSPKPLPRVIELLAGFSSPVFVVLGNHDHWVDAHYLRTGFERLGYTVLQNEHRVLHLRGAPVAVLGIDDGRTGRDDVEGTFRGAPESGTRLVLTHAPPTIDKLPPNGNLVQFSGHTHGGQFVVRGLTEAIFRRAGQPYIQGHYHVRGNQLYVNMGLGFGFGGPYLRRGTYPEVAFFTLRHVEAASAHS